MSHNRTYYKTNSKIPSMRESGYYPPGAEYDPSAPWNQVEQESKEFKVCISQSLSKSTVISTNDYVKEYEEESGNYRVHTDETDWKKALNEDDCAFTPLDLIKEFKSFLEEELKKDENSNPYNERTKRLEKLKREKYKMLIKECEGWIEDDIEIMEE